MKKSFLILTAAMGLATTACNSSSFGGGKIETTEDSVAYALGLDVAHSFYTNIDPNLDYNLICQGIADYFNENSSISVQQNQEFLQTYFQVTLPAKKSVENEKSSNEMLAAAAKMSGAESTESGLIYIIEDKGSAPTIVEGDEVVAHYVLYDASGNMLQSSKDSGQPMTWVNTPGSMIAGFKEGVEMLGEGGKATLFLPYDLAYGEQGNQMIGPKMALKFEVEVVSVKKGE